MMSRCFTWFPISGLGEPEIYHNSGMFYKNVGILLGECLTCEELSGGYSQGMMGFVSLGFRNFKSRSSKNTPEML